MPNLKTHKICKECFMNAHGNEKAQQLREVGLHMNLSCPDAFDKPISPRGLGVPRLSGKHNCVGYPCIDGRMGIEAAFELAKMASEGKVPQGYATSLEAGILEVKENNEVVFTNAGKTRRVTPDGDVFIKHPTKGFVYAGNLTKPTEQ